ncbi:hypothetical protein [Brevundimonas sp.]|uniref:hypothetical protein n=1 Tax=Brevundimonas sp. TaxID=1871086 RepID=UPI00289F5AB3|nr:hypothetical protein [Brevundimonas sp.]
MARRRLPYGPKNTLDQALLLAGEVATDVTEHRLRIGDGVTLGGVPQARKDETDAAIAELGLLKDQVENAGTTIVVSTAAALAALPGPFTAGARAEVRKDPAGDVPGGNGVWRHNGSAWAWLDDLVPQSVQQSISAAAREEAGMFLKDQPHADFDTRNIAFGLQDREGRFAPIMDVDRRLVQIAEDGELERVPTARDLGGMAEPGFGYIDGHAPVEVVIDVATRRVLSFWTAEQKQYRLGEGGVFDLVAGAGGVAASEPLTYRAQAWAPFNRTAIHTAQDEVCYIRVLMGQSLATGQTSSGDAIIAATPLYPDHALMLDGSANEGPRRLIGMGATGFVPLVEKNNGAVNPAKETPASAWANTLTRDVEAATGRRITTLTIVAAQGAQAYAGLKRGQPAWTAMLEALDQAARLCRAQGLIPVVTAGAWLGSEGDADTGQTTPATVERQLKQMARHFAADAQARTGQAEPPVLLVCQCAYTPAADIWARDVQMGAVRADGQEGVRLAGPHYQHPYSDSIHLNALGYNRLGQDLARLELAEWFGTGGRAIKPVNAYWASTTEVVIEFDAPTYPLVIDTSGAVVNTTGLTASAGFVFDDRSGAAPAVSSVAVLANRSLKLTLASAPTGRSGRIGYAVARTSGTSDGPVSGARGLIRDSTSVTSIYGGEPSRNWCPAFILEIGKP